MGQIKNIKLHIVTDIKGFVEIVDEEMITSTTGVVVTKETCSRYYLCVPQHHHQYTVPASPTTAHDFLNVVSHGKTLYILPPTDRCPGLVVSGCDDDVIKSVEPRLHLARTQRPPWK